MTCVPARQIRDPVGFLVLVKAYDFRFHVRELILIMGKPYPNSSEMSFT